MDPLLDAEITAGAGTSEQKTWRLVRPVTLIGFTQHAHIRVEGSGIESVHAALLNTGDAIVLADLVSRQGVFCGADRIKLRVLQAGDFFRLGTCLMRLDCEPGAHLPAVSDEKILRLPQMIHLKTVSGEPQEWFCDAIGTVIGSRPGCSVRLASKDVLPLHALLTRVGSQIVLASLAADKSLRVNGTSASVSIVQGGDTLTIWPITLDLKLAPANSVASALETFPPALQEQPDMANVAKAQPALTTKDGDDTPETATPIPSAPPAATSGTPAPGELDAPPPAPTGEIPELNSRLLQMEEQLRDSSRQLRQWQAQLEHYANGLIRRDAELAKRSTQLDQLQSALQTTEGRLQRRSEEVGQMEASLQTQREDLARRESQLAARSQAIEHFGQVMADAWEQLSK
jgi:hypothetical protein